MEAILLKQQNTADLSEYDLQYFYSKDDFSRSTCGIAFRTLLDIYRPSKDSLSDGLDNWYDAISLSPNSLGIRQNICASLWSNKVPWG